MVWRAKKYEERIQFTVKWFVCNVSLGAARDWLVSHLEERVAEPSLGVANDCFHLAWNIAHGAASIGHLFSQVIVSAADRV